MTPARHAARCLASHDDAAASSSTIVEIRLRPTTTAAALSLDPSLDATRRLEYRLQGSFYFTYSVRPSYKTEENENFLRIYGFEGEAGGDGEGFTRIRESNHRQYMNYDNR